MESVLNTGKTKKDERFTGVLEGNLVSGDVTNRPRGHESLWQSCRRKESQAGTREKETGQAGTPVD